MAIHGIVSTYFGDLEYDIGKSFTWTKWFCDDVYAMDINISDGSRQYVLDWDRFNTDVKYSLYSRPFFTSPTTAATWRKTSYQRAKAAWNYQDDDWVLFIDGTEGFNVFHKPSVRLELSEVELDGSAHTATITTSDTHSIEVGNTVKLVGSQTVLVPYQVAGSYVHTQDALDANSQWVVTHNLDGSPTVATFTVFDTDEQSVGVNIDIAYDDQDVLTVSFTDLVFGNPIDVYGSISFITSDIPEQLLELDGSYLVTDVPNNTSFVIENDSIVETLYAIPFRNRYLRDETGEILLNEDDEPVERTDQPEAWVSFEPPGYFEGDIFQSWINYEIENSGDADFISLDGWALVRSGPPTPLVLKTDRYELQRLDSTATSCEEYYLPMGSLIRLAKVSALNAADDLFWLKLDQPQEPSVDVYAAENLSLISYAYARWAENPTQMTQSVNPEAPHYVSGDSTEPPLRPVDVSVDTGYAMRRLISQVRPLDDLLFDPSDWGSPFDDPIGEQPMLGEYKKLEQFYIPERAYENGYFVTSGFAPQGGSNLYPGILRSNLREGIWYVKGTYGPSTKASVTSGGISSAGVAQIITAKAHNISVGQSIVVFGAPPAFNGNYVVTEVPSNKALVYQRDVDGIAISSFSFQSEYPLAQVMTVGDYVGLIPWDYLLSSVGVDDPEAWVTAGNSFKKTI